MKPFVVKILLVFVFILQVSACSHKPPQTINEIDFASGVFPEAVAEITGLSAQESWGRWSDADVAPLVTIRFKQPLPKNFTLAITGQSLPEHEAFKVRIGNFQQEMFIHGVGETAKVYPDLSAAPDTIEIIPENPVTPKSLKLNDDARKLGIGLMRITISN